MLIVILWCNLKMKKMKKTGLFILVSLLVVSLGTSVFADGKDKKNKKADASASVSATAIASTAVISGRVVDADTGEALTGVLVKISGTDREVFTDFDGEFVLRGIMPGDYDLVTKLISYKVHVDKSIQVSQGGEKKVKIKMKKN